MDDGLVSNELRAILKLSLSSKDDITAYLSDGEDRPQIPVLRALINAILFSRRFLPTYLAVLIVLVLCWSVLKSIRSNKARCSSLLPADRVGDASVASSSSSTLQGTESPPVKDVDDEETTPLLQESQAPVSSRVGRMMKGWYRVRSWLLYQPKPIPSLTSARNTLPANEVSVAILLFLGLNLFYMFYNLPLSKQMIFAFADRAGLLFVVNLPVLYLLAAKNSQPFQRLTGWSYEGLNVFHRRLGEWMTIAALLHMVGMIVAFYQLLAPAGFSIWWYLTRKIIIFGCIAFCLYLGIYFTSIGYFRQRLYELFLVSHIIFQVTALVMLFFHHHHARLYVLSAVVIWILDRGVSRIGYKTETFIATLSPAADGQTTLLFIDVPLRAGKRIGLHAGWRTGQHIFITVPAMGMRYRFQAHPFTIASPAPPVSSQDAVWPLQLTIRAQDGFSRDLLEYAKLHQHTKILVDGPYSSDHVSRAVVKANRVCLVAGGSGIAVTYPYAWQRLFPSATFDCIIHNRPLYCNGVKVLRKLGLGSFRTASDDFAHFWIRQDARHESWITMLPSTSRLELPHDTLTPQTAAVDLVTQRFDTRGPGGEHQRPDIKAEVEAWVCGDQKQNLDPGLTTCIVVSGPDGMVRDVQNAAASLAQNGWCVEVHVEKFGW